MQVERYPQEMSDEIRKQMGMTTFDEPEPFEVEEMEKHLEDPTVKEVHAFKATPRNMEFANLRKKHPGYSRRQLRRLMNRKK